MLWEDAKDVNNQGCVTPSVSSGRLLETTQTATFGDVDHRYTPMTSLLTRATRSIQSADMLACMPACRRSKPLNVCMELPEDTGLLKRQGM